ncbi:MAG: glucosidase [Anaerolineae bacterium SG8_19]|nr:MAG: glucosidase [Anaerolineae bacterium SG8_19]
MNPEEQRLRAAREEQIPWKKWGPYLSERQWGVVREDYSEDGDAWAYFSHDQARSRAYRWGEDGLAGISDDRQTLCFALALWNGRDPILKERLFGLTNGEGNHGEDVKEYYFYLDSTPTHSYMKYLYKYPQAKFPYADLVQTNQQRTADDFEYELLATGVFDEDRYFDLFVEYAKESPEDILIQVTAHNRGSETATLHLLPTLWFRNTWSWSAGATKPSLQQDHNGKGFSAILASHPALGETFLYVAGDAPHLFTDNETNTARLFGSPNATPYVKDGINDAVVGGKIEAVNPAQTGTKVAPHFQLVLGPGQSEAIRLRLTETAPGALSTTYPGQGNPFGRHFDTIMRTRRKEADAFYADITPASLSADEKNVMRQALAGMLWTKQYYNYDVSRWLNEHGLEDRASLQQSSTRNKNWFHMVNSDIISMPDKWEYPWYAAWDLAFHTVALALVDLDFAKDQLELMLNERYLHPNGQMPAYEWNFGDVNPPVHAWALMRVYAIERMLRGQGDIDFLQDAFHKLMLNFTWWVNRKDPDGKDIFGGGFLGLDNIGVFDRSAPLPTGGHIEQSDGTAWMAFYSLAMLQIALELAHHDPAYQSMASKFFEHFLWIYNAMDPLGERGDALWDEEDGFFYDVLRLPDGRATRLKVRSLVGLLPLAACTVVLPDQVQRLPEFMERVFWLNEHRPRLVGSIPSLSEPGPNDRRLLAILDEAKLRRVLATMLDEAEFLSPYGIRSISRFHREHPYVLNVGGAEYRVDYLPAESNSGMFGGNSNWRGPIWFPMNLLLIRGLVTLYAYYGDKFTVECPTGSGQQMTLWQISQEISRRLGRIFLQDDDGRRPVYGGLEKFQTDPHWRDHILFHEYFHGDNGAGLGASHQTGWTGVVAWIMRVYGTVTDFEAVVEDVAGLPKEGKARLKT